MDADLEYWMNSLRRDFGEWLEHKSALGHSRVWDLKLWLVDNQVSIEEDVEVDNSWSSREGAFAAPGMLDRLTHLEQCARSQSCLQLDGDVEKPRLGKISDRFGAVKRRYPPDALSLVCEVAQCSLEISHAISNIGAHGKVDSLPEPSPWGRADSSLNHPGHGLLSFFIGARC